jgi:hypothetical protein
MFVAYLPQAAKEAIAAPVEPLPASPLRDVSEPQAVAVARQGRA